MLRTEATPEMLEIWKRISAAHKDKLKPNRKTGKEIVSFLLSKYPLRELHDEHALSVITGNVLDNGPYSEKLLPNEMPKARAFIVENNSGGCALYEKRDDLDRESGNDIFVGVDVSTGFFMVEGCAYLWDELCAFRGLDALDIENYYCVAEYLSCLERFRPD